VTKKISLLQSQFSFSTPQFPCWKVGQLGAVLAINGSGGVENVESAGILSLQLLSVARGATAD